MNIQILFETYSSTTAGVVEIMEKKLQELGHAVEIGHMKDHMNFMEKPTDLVIFATPSWFDRGQEGQPHISFLEFMDQNQHADFSKLTCAFVGLGDSNYPHFCLAIDTLEDFFTKRGAKNITNALKLDNFQF
ncbi:flavodoxin-like domain-containing protein, partial [Candidatus Woesebacteria bacterium]|nr:flavodoxin-like domain-containing protein [Candidatus Woesebacteria bacterium]